MFGRKNKEKIKELEREINKIGERCDMLYKELRDENAQLRRILENISNEPTYMLKDEIEHISYYRYKGHVFLSDDNYITSYRAVRHEYLYIYIDRKEYRIGLTELNSLDIVKGSEDFWVDEDNKGLAHFDVLTGKEERTRHKFLIEYKSSKYLYSQEPFGEGGEVNGEDV